MLCFELHEDAPGEEDLLQAGVDLMQHAFKHYGLIDITNCKFTIIRNGPEYVASGKSSPFLRIVVTPGDDVYIITCLIRAREDITRIASYGIDVVTMPTFIPPGKRTGHWYDPSDPLRASQHAETKGDNHG